MRCCSGRTERSCTSYSGHLKFLKEFCTTHKQLMLSLNCYYKQGCLGSCVLMIISIACPPPLSFYFAVLSFLLFSNLLFFSAFQSTWLKGFMELALQTAQKKKRVHIGKRQIHYKSLKPDSGHWLICHRDTFLCDSFPRAFMCQLIPTSQRLSSISRVKRWAWDDASARPVSGDSLQLLKTDCVH